MAQTSEDAGYPVVEAGDARGALAALREVPAIALMLTGLKVLFMTG